MRRLLIRINPHAPQPGGVKAIGLAIGALAAVQAMVARLIAWICVFLRMFQVG